MKRGRLKLVEKIKTKLGWACIVACECGRTVRMAETTFRRRSSCGRCVRVRLKPAVISKPALPVGSRYGKLVVEGVVVGSREGKGLVVRCDCGRSLKLTAGRLTGGHRTSCGACRGE